MLRLHFVLSFLLSLPQSITCKPIHWDWLIKKCKKSMIKEFRMAILTDAFKDWLDYQKINLKSEWIDQSKIQNWTTYKNKKKHTHTVHFQLGAVPFSSFTFIKGSTNILEAIYKVQPNLVFIYLFFCKLY